MKTKFTKRLLSIVLALLMVITTMPFTAITSFAATADIAKLNSAIAAYETKMNGTVYTNMKPAYDAYVTAQKAKEAFTYGDYESYPNGDTYATDLTNKTNAMTAWSAYTGTKKGSYVDDSVKTDTAYNKAYQNVLWAETGMGASGDAYKGEALVAGKSDYKANCYMQYKDTTLLYDGTNPTGFVNVWEMVGNTKPCNYNWNNLRVHFIYISSNEGFKYKTNWGPKQSNYDSTWGITQNAGGCSGTTNSTSKNVNDMNNGKISNVLYYEPSTAPTAIMSEFQPTISFDIGYDNGHNTYQNEKMSGRTIRVLNYKKVVDAINTAKNSYLSNISKYKFGGLSTVMNGFDLATKDPNSYFTSSNNYQSCQTNYEAAVSDLGATATQDTSYTITAKKGTSTLATFTLSKGCKAKTVEYALKTVTPANDNDADGHNSYSWPATVDVSGNKEYVAVKHTDSTHTYGSWYSINDTTKHSRKCSTCEYIDYGTHTSVSANNAVDATCTTDGKESDTVCSGCGQTLTTGAKIDANGHSFKNYVSNEDATCTADGTKTAKCDNCDAIDTKADTGSATGHKYAVSGSRYVCENDAKHIKTDANTGEEIDLQAYNDTVTEANAKLQETDVYTAESLAALQGALDLPANQLDALKDNTQGDVDAKTTAIRTAIEKLELLVIKYNVQFFYQFQGEEAVEVINASYDKDEEIELKVPEDALAQGVVYKWYTSTTDGAKPYATSVNSTTLIVNKDIIIVAKLQKNTTEVESAVKVNLLDKSGKTIAIAYTSASSITLGENSITVDGNELEAKQIPFYNVRGFKVDGGSALSSTTYQIPEGVTEINVMPNYVAEKKIVITVNSDVKLNGKSVSSYEATWNQAITMTAETEVNWYANGKLIAQGTTYKFCANADVTITAETTAPVTTDPSVEIGYFNYDSSLNKVTVVSNFYAPQGTISDAGVILSTKTSDIETLKKATGGVFKVNSGNFTSNGNQVKISVSRTATTHFTMYALAFVVVDGVTYYADSVSTCVY